MSCLQERGLEGAEDAILSVSKVEPLDTGGSHNTLT